VIAQQGEDDLEDPSRKHGVMDSPVNVPLSPTAVLSPRKLPHLGLKRDGQIFLVFPRSTPFTQIQRIANICGAEIYVCYVIISYSITTENHVYDHSPRISL
jgi:hypothetical protein